MIWLFGVTVNRLWMDRNYLRNYRLICLCKWHQKIINTTTGETYLFGAFTFLDGKLVGRCVIMQQVVDKQAGPHLLEKNQQQKDRNSTLYDRVVSH